MVDGDQQTAFLSGGPHRLAVDSEYARPTVGGPALQTPGGASWPLRRAAAPIGFSVILEIDRPTLGSSRAASVRYDGMPCTYIRTASSTNSSVKLARGRAAFLSAVKLVLHMVQRNLCSGLS